MTAALAIFPGATVVACPACGGGTWRRAGGGEVCVTCHAAPGSTTAGTIPKPTMATIAGEGATLLALAEARGFPPVMLRPGITVQAGAAAWQTFATRGTREDRAAAWAALRA